MPVRNAVLSLPNEVRERLDILLVENGFSNYVALAEWLQQQGFEISKSTLHRYGSAFEEKLGALRIATQQAQAIAEAVGDDENALGDALVRLTQQKAFEVLMQLQVEDVSDVDLPKLARAISDLNRSAVQQKKWQIETRDKVEAKLRELEQSNHPLSQSIDPHTLKRVREEIYGLF